MNSDPEFHSFDLHALAREFPAAAESMLIDRYLTDEAVISTRLFRVYRPTPAHYHRCCDERLFVLQGRGCFWASRPENEITFDPGSLLIFQRLIVHAMPVLLQEPIIFLAIDTPRRDPADVHFVSPEDGTAESFIRQR